MNRHAAYLSIGANIGDKMGNLRYAVNALRNDDLTSVRLVSPLYRTLPVGYEEQPDFLNAVIAVETERTPRELLGLCANIEDKLGRKRTIRWGPRVIDIDILLYDDIDIEESDLVIPHPRMMERAFVLVPLADVAPGLVLPNGITAEDAANAIDHDGIELVMGESWSEK